jgi:hypothetical protein
VLAHFERFVREFLNQQFGGQLGMAANLDAVATRCDAFGVLLMGAYEKPCL